MVRQGSKGGGLVRQESKGGGLVRPGEIGPVRQLWDSMMTSEQEATSRGLKKQESWSGGLEKQHSRSGGLVKQESRRSLGRQDTRKVGTYRYQLRSIFVSPQ